MTTILGGRLQEVRLYLYVIFVKPAKCCHTPPQRQVCSGTALSVATQANVGMTVFAAMRTYMNICLSI